jgi:hypothetical protein
VADRCLRTREFPDPSAEALVTLLEAERSTARNRMPQLVADFDPDQVLLLWFAIGATNAICAVVDRPTDSGRDEILQHAIGVIFKISDMTSEAMAGGPWSHRSSALELFEDAGRRAVHACLTGDAGLSYYLDALSKYARSNRPPLNS